MWDATMRKSNTPLPAADAGPRPPRGFSVLDVVENYVVPDPNDLNHPSVRLPLASHDPFRISDAALRSDQVGFDDTDVRTNQCVVGVTELQAEAQHYVEMAPAPAEERPVIPAEDP